MNFALFIREIGRGATGARDMSRAEAQQLYGAMLDGAVPELELGAIAIALRMKSETVDEMVGFLAAASERLPALRRPQGRIRPVVIPTYNGARRNANLTPLLALLLQRYGVPVLLHGLSDDYGRVTSEQVLRQYGLLPSGSLQEAQLRIDEHHLTYLPLPLLSAGLDRQLALRNRLGLRNSAHSLVKMLDPFQGDACAARCGDTPRLPDQHACRAYQCRRPMRSCCAAAKANPSPTPGVVRRSSISTAASAISSSRPSTTASEICHSCPRTVTQRRRSAGCAASSPARFRCAADRQPACLLPLRLRPGNRFSSGKSAGCGEGNGLAMV
jgi:hypothetical protein